METLLIPEDCFVTPFLAMTDVPTKTLKSGFTMPVFGLGTWMMGGAQEQDPGNDDEGDITAIRRAIEHGITHIDTAELYAGGYTEVLVGQAIRDIPRSGLFLTSKVHRSHMTYDGIRSACEASLERLGTGYLDLYLLHSFTADTPLEDQVCALDRLVDEGIVKHIGVANYGVENLRRIQALSRNKIVCDQVHYNLQVREAEVSGLLRYCQENDTFLMAWRPLGKGTLNENIPNIVNEVAQKYNKTPTQIALNWLLSQANVLVISKSRTPAHLEDSLGAIGWMMDEADIELLRREYPDQRDVSEAVPLDGHTR